MIISISLVLLTIMSRMINKLWAHNSISFQHMSVWCPFLDSKPTIDCSNIGDHTRLETELGTSTLLEFSDCVIAVCATTYKVDFKTQEVWFWRSRKNKGTSLKSFFLLNLPSCLVFEMSKPSYVARWVALCYKFRPEEYEICEICCNPIQYEM